MRRRVLPGEADVMFPPQRNGRAASIWSRTGNRVEAKTSGVAAFTLLLSPDQFDLARAVTVVVNGRTVVRGDGAARHPRTLLNWAARDNDRTMLFAAELQVDGVHRNRRSAKASAELIRARRLARLKGRRAPSALISARRCRRRSSCRRAS